MKRLSRRAALAGSLAFAAPARAEEPPLRLVLGFPPGASSDTLTRLVADKMRLSLGRTVVVENKTGAVGIVANLAVKAAAPDGNTLLMTPLANMVAFPHSYSKLDYDPFKDYVPVAELATFDLAFGVGASVPARTLAEYAALAKSGGTYANFASAAAGSLPHFFGLMFAKAAGCSRPTCPTRATANVMQAMMSGEIPAAMLHVADWGTLAQSGKGRMLAVRAPGACPNIPTCRPSRRAATTIEGSAWYALFAPGRHAAGHRRQAVAAAARRRPPARRAPEARAARPAGDGAGPAEMARILRADYDKWGPVIRASGFKAD
jgi:tripartite-type tricarboxylate transporter receptor subunit TctC